MKHKHFNQGFTIIELLIVIVVVAILATISVVAYGNIANRAYDTAIQSDLSQFKKSLMMFASETGNYPRATQFFEEVARGAVSKEAYDVTVYNLYYCSDASKLDQFGIAARSKSGKNFTISSNDSIQEISMNPERQPACEAFGGPGYVLSNTTFNYGYHRLDKEWRFGL